MKQLALALDLKDDPDVIQAYKEYHASVWPEVKESLLQVGIHQMKIWLVGRRLFMLVDVDDAFDPAIDFPRYVKLHPRCQEWEDLMGTYQAPLPQAGKNSRWALMEEVFKLV